MRPAGRKAGFFASPHGGRLATIRERMARWINGAGASTAPPSAALRGRSIDTLVEHLRQAYGLGDDEAGKLTLIRRGAIYACTTLRADMLSGLPINLYRVGDAPAGGRAVNLRSARARMGKPAMVGGRRLAEYGTAEQIQSHAVLDVLQWPNADWTGRAMVRMLELGLGLVGQGHLQLHRGETGTGTPAAMSWVKHSRMDVIKPGSADAPPDVKDARTVAGWWIDPYTPGAKRLLPGEVVWLRYPDPDDPDYGALSPAGIASTAANAYHEAMSSNRALFRNGLRAAGAFVPPVEMESFGWEQADEITRDVNALLSGAANTHKTPVFPYRFDFTQFGVSPKDAEFVALMDFAIEDTARAYRIPIEMVGGTRRTYQNAEVADVALWQRALEPEACWIADELGAKLLPAFGLDPREYFLGFDLSSVTALQADESAEWARQREQIAAGVLLASEWRAGAGLPELKTQGASIEVGKVTAILAALTSMGQGLVTAESTKALIVEAIGLSPQAAAAIVGDGAPPPAPDDTDPDADAEAASVASLAQWLGGLDAPTGATEPHRRAAPEYGSDDHLRIMRAAEDAWAPHEKRFAAEVRKLFRDQEKSLVEKLTTGERAAGDAHTRLGIGDVFGMFDRQRWVKRFREVAMRELSVTMAAGGDATVSDLDADKEFDPKTPPVIRALRQRSQRFATEVNATTWSQLKASLEESIKAGETPREQAARVQEVMGKAIRSRADVIARTETHGAYGQGSREAAKQTGLRLNKVWQSSQDSRVRDDHKKLHGQTVGMDEDFRVGSDRGPGPGDMGSAEMDVNCRCVLTYERVKSRAGAIIGGDHADTQSL